MSRAAYTSLESGIIAGVIPDCKGVVAFGKNRRDCREQLQAVLESWILVRLKLGHTLPIIHGIDLNKEPLHEESHSL